MAKEETVLTTTTISSQGQITITKPVQPWLPYEAGDIIEFVLKGKDIVIRNTHRK